MARIVSKPTTLEVTNLPSWLPARGSWAQVALPASTPRARLDAVVAGDFTHNGSGFKATRNMGINGLSWDFNGALWNPFYGKLGGWVLSGGGHASHWGMVDSGVYIWDAETRLWTRFIDPVYPGDIPTTPSWGGTPQTSNVNQLGSEFAILKEYGELTANERDGYTPAASHDRWLKTLIPPGRWGVGPMGGMAVPFQSSYHWPAIAQSWQGHILDFGTKKWKRIGDQRPYIDGRCSGGAIDGEGNLYRRISYGIEVLPHNGTTWTKLAISGSNRLAEFGPVVWIPGTNALATLVGSNSYPGEFSFYLVDLERPSTLASPGMTGTPPHIPGATSYAYPFTGIGWCSDLNGLILLSPTNWGVYLLSRPADPFTQPWQWRQLPSSNTPGMRNLGGGYYNRFQFAPALKSFFICGDATTEGMWCFRPAEL